MKNTRTLISLLIFCLILSILSIIFYINQDKITNTLIEKEAIKVKEDIVNKKYKDKNEEEPEGLEPSYDTSSVEEVTVESFIKHKNEFKKVKAKSRIEIPSINLNLPIFAGINQTHLLLGAGEQIKGMKAGDVGNYILAAHRMPYTSGLGFNKIERLKEGDLVYIYDDNSEYIYNIFLVKRISDSETRYLNDYNDRKILTLYTCQDLSETSGNTDKVIVQAELVE